MKDFIENILQYEVEDVAYSISEIVGLGIVNQVFQVRGDKSDYVIRLNEDSNQITEYKKEQWCLGATRQLGIACPSVLKVGEQQGIAFMIQEKLEGENGSL
ncbi:MAG: phosphotransferase, partial [Bacteroidota bacterium]